MYFIDYVCRVKNWWDYLLLIRRTMPHCLLQSPRLPRLDWPGPISPLNYLITKSRWYLWIILSPYHAGIFELSWHQVMLVYLHTIELSTTIDLSITKSSSYLIISYHRPIRALPLRVPWSIFSIQSLAALTAYHHTKDKCIRQVSPVHKIGFIFSASCVYTAAQ